MQADPYAQDKAELIAGKLFVDPQMKLSEPVIYSGLLTGVLATVRQLQHKCGFPESKYQVKFNADRNVLRLSDYFTRHAGEPGDYFWLWGDVILGGTMDDYADHAAISLWARGGLEPVEGEVSAQAYAIVAALKRLRSGASQ